MMMMYPFVYVLVNEDDRMLVIVCVVVRRVFDITNSNCLTNMVPMKKKNTGNHRQQ